MSSTSTSLASPTTINDLSYETLDDIFTYLGVYDIGRCMMVSKRWNSVGSGFKIKELILKGKSDTYYNKWCTKELFDPKMMISKYDPGKPLPLNCTFLRRLAIVCLNEINFFQLVHLNNFVHLQHLELTYFTQESQHQRIIFLNLPNLKTVRCRGIDCKLVFNAPALEEVFMSGSHNVRFRNIPTLKLLEYDASISNGNEYAYVFNRIKSVEVFRINYNLNLHVMLDVLTHLNDVKEIRFEFRFFSNCIGRDYFEEWMAEIFEHRRDEKKTNVKIFLFDKLMVEGKPFDEYGFETVPGLHVR